MTDIKEIKTALISVFHKDGLDEILRILNSHGVKFLSTGGTRNFIESQGYKCDAVGRPDNISVNTWRPGENPSSKSVRRNSEPPRQHNRPGGSPSIPDSLNRPCDCGFIPFEETVASGASEADIIEKIDIGGISLIRAAAKNFNDVVIVPSKMQYEPLRRTIAENGAKTSLNDRIWFAKEAFAVSSKYDSAIFNYFDGNEKPTALRVAIDSEKTMRYGENPHQKGFFFGRLDKLFEQIHGKEISYNNLLDIDSATSLISEFDEPTFAILKHNNACGVASRETVIDAWKDALAGDPVSAFGGVLICNRPIDAATAAEVNKIFFEVIIAPDYTPEAIGILEQKKNRIILRQKAPLTTTRQFRSVLNGALVQERDLKHETPEDLRLVTTTPVDNSRVEDLLFANKLVKHCKSNAIVLAKTNSYVQPVSGRHHALTPCAKRLKKLIRSNST